MLNSIFGNKYILLLYLFDNFFKRYKSSRPKTIQKGKTQKSHVKIEFYSKFKGLPNNLKK